MAADKQSFELKANYNSAETWVGETRIRLESGATYDTSDPSEIAALDAWDVVKRAEAPAKKSSGGDK